MRLSMPLFARANHPWPTDHSFPATFLKRSEKSSDTAAVEEDWLHWPDRGMSATRPVQGNYNFKNKTRQKVSASLVQAKFVHYPDTM